MQWNIDKYKAIRGNEVSVELQEICSNNQAEKRQNKAVEQEYI